MKKLFILFGICCLTVSLGADNRIESKSPDGKFGLLNAYEGRPPYNGKSELVDAHTRAVIVTLDSDRPSMNKLVWSKDSKSVAYFKDNSEKGATRIFYRDGSSFSEMKLVDLPVPKLSPDGASAGSEAETRIRVEPIRWLDSGDLVLESEVQAQDGRRAALEITIGFDQQHQPAVRKSEPEQASLVDYFLLLPKDCFEDAPAGWLTVIRSGNGMIDKKNGYLSCGGDGAQPEFEVALFRYRDGRPLLAVCSGELEGEDSLFLYFYEMGANGRMQRATRWLFPFAGGYDEEGAVKGDFKFELPRRGKTIVIRAHKAGKSLHKVTWNGEKFIEN